MTDQGRPNPSRRPILIFGACKRTGTNFLTQLLQRHRDLGSPKPVWEHYLLEEADLLRVYADRTRGQWSSKWAELDPISDDLLDHLGGGLLRFLEDRCEERRVVAKCPSSVNLSLARSLFRSADLVLLVRDGRSVTESMVNGFGFSHERAARRWARGARELLDFTRDPASADVRFTLVRYEDILEDSTARIAELLSFLELDPDRYDWDAAEALPVFGSSFAKEGEVSWRGIERPADFDPSTRFADWDAALRSRFDWIGGDLLEAFGYERDASATAGPVRQRGLDAVWPVRDLARRVGERIST